MTGKLKTREKIKSNKLFKDNGCFLWPIFRFPDYFFSLVEERKENWGGERSKECRGKS